MGTTNLTPIQNFKETIYDNVLNVGTDIAEISIDALMEDGIVKDIPVIGTIYKIGKTVTAVKDIVSTKRTLVFAQQVQHQNIGKDVLQKHKEKLIDDPKKFNKELEVILDYLEKQTGYLKAKILGKFYYLYLSNRCKWSDFGLLADITSSVSIYDFDMLEDLYQKKEYTTKSHSFDHATAKRLDRCSLIDYFNGMPILSSEGPDKQVLAQINNIGRIFYEQGLKGENFKVEELK